MTVLRRVIGFDWRRLHCRLVVYPSAEDVLLTSAWEAAPEQLVSL